MQGVDRVAGEGGIGLERQYQQRLARTSHPALVAAYEINSKTVVRLGYGRSFDMGVFGSNFGHAVTQNLPVLASQVTQNAVQNLFPAFILDSGPPIFTFPAIPSNGLSALGGAGLLPGEFRGHRRGHQHTELHTYPTSVPRSSACQLWMRGM